MIFLELQRLFPLLLANTRKELATYLLSFGPLSVSQLMVLLFWPVITISTSNPRLPRKSKTLWRFFVSTPIVLPSVPPTHHHQRISVVPHCRSSVKLNRRQLCTLQSLCVIPRVLQSGEWVSDVHLKGKGGNSHAEKKDSEESNETKPFFFPTYAKLVDSI